MEYQPHSCDCVAELDASGEFVRPVTRCKLHVGVDDKEFWAVLKSHAAQFDPSGQTSSKSETASDTWQEVFGEDSSPARRERVMKALVAAHEERERIRNLKLGDDKEGSSDDR